MLSNPLSRHVITLWMLGLGLLGAAQVAYAPPPLPRVAMVIGISKHQDPKLGTLRTARNDAEDVARSLTHLGYQVTAQFDSELSPLREGIAAFSEKLKSDSFRDALALVYFAGYGLQKSGRNFLLPANFDASIESQNLDKTAIAVYLDIIEKIGGRKGGANVIILDACREDPFGQRQGLAQVDNVPNGTLVELAAEPNNPSIENLDPKAPERNGVFAKQLLKKLDQPNPDIDVRHFFDIVGNNVYEASNKSQKPRVMTAQTPPAMPEMVSMFQESTPTHASDEELKFWKRVDKSTEICAFEKYIERWPKGQFVDSAQATINAIKSKIESAPKAFSDLPLDLRIKVTESFKSKEAAAKAECEQKWANGASGIKASRFEGTRRGINTVAIRDPLPLGQLRQARIWSSKTRSQGAGQESPATLGGARVERPVAGRYSYSSAAWTTQESQVEGLHQVVDRLAYSQADYAVEPWMRPDQVGGRSHSRNLRVALEQDGETLSSAPASRPVEGDEEFQADLLEAEQGELNAMFRVALVYEAGGHDVKQDTTEMMHWLVLSSSLGNGLASYKLHRYFAAEPTGYTKAVKFKGLADKQGYYGPVKLSDRR